MPEKKLSFYTCAIIFATAIIISLPAANGLARMTPENPLHKLSSDVRAKISPELSRLFINADKTKPIRVLIRLKKNKSLEPLESDSPSFKHRRRQILGKLKRQAQNSQTGIVGLIKRKRQDRIERLLKKGPRKYGEVPRVFDPIKNYWVSNTVVVTVSPEDLEEIAAHPDVLEVSENTVLSIPPLEALGGDDGTPLDLWNFAAIGLDQISGLGLDGDGVRLGFIDTGIDPSHPDLAGKLIGWAEFGESGDVIDSEPHETHPHGHGTQVASILAGDVTGIAPGARLLAVMALPGGNGTIEQVLAGMQWIIDPDNDPDTDDGAQIVNMSWGSNGLSAVLNEAVENMAAAGVLPVCAIGNSWWGATMSPGNAPKAIGVGALERNNTVATYSGGGKVCWTEEICLTKPDIAAPGSSISGIGAEGEYQIRSGTSFAAPHVAGAAALLLQANPDMTLSQLRGFLLNTTVDHGAPGPDTRYGRGPLDVASVFDFVDRYAFRFETKDLVLETVEPSGDDDIHLYHTYFSNGEGKVDDPLTLTVQCESDLCHTLGLADVDGDGYSDLVLSQTESGHAAGYRHLINVYRALDAGGFAAKAQTWHSYTSASSDPPDVIGLADVNGDLKSDLVLREIEQPNGYHGIYRYYSRSIIHVCLSNGQDSFEPQDQEWAAVGHQYFTKVGFGLGDCDGDGRADLICSQLHNYLPNWVYYYLHRSNGNGFETPLSPAGVIDSIFYGKPLRLLNAADADGDGFDDLILAGEVVLPRLGTPVYVGLSRGSASLNGFFPEQVWSTNLPLQRGSSVTAVSDVDGDGAADLIIKTAAVNPQIGVWLSNGWNQFEKSLDEWFDATTISSTADFQIVGVANIGLGSWH